MKRVLLIITMLFLAMSCGEPKEYEMTVGDYIDRLTFIQNEAKEIYESQATALYSLEDTTGRVEKLGKYYDERNEYVKKKRGLSDEDLTLLKNATERLGKDYDRLKLMTVGEVIKSQKQVEGK